jgi:hypothetical protein
MGWPRWMVLSAAGSAPAGSASGSARGPSETARRRDSSWPPSCPPGLLGRRPGIHVKPKLRLVRRVILCLSSGYGEPTRRMCRH